MTQTKKLSKLTRQNYYTEANTFLSFSKLKMFWFDREFFRDLYITHTRIQEKTPAMQIGQGVDLFVMKGKKAFEKEFVRVERRNLKSPPKGVTELSAHDFDLCINMALKVRSTPAFEDLKGFQKQPILQYPMPMGLYFTGICGIPDWLWVNGDTAEIVDLKTVHDIEKFPYAIRDFGYDFQMAQYTELVERIYGASVFTYKFLCVEKGTKGVYRCKTFVLEKDHVELARQKLRKTWEEIAREKEFFNPPISWQNAEKI